jgi:hypothetical protein
LVLGLGLVASAEEAAPMGFNVMNVDVKPGSQQQFEGFIAAYKKAVDKVGGRTWFAESPGIGSTTGYSFAFPFNSFAELADQTNPVLEAFGAEEAQKIYAMYAASAVSATTTTFHGRPDLSMSNDGEGAEIVMTFGITLNPGMTEKFENWVKKFAAAADDRSFNVYQKGVGDGPDYVARVPMKWADLDTPAKPIPEVLEAKYGKKEAAKLMADNLAAVASIVESVTRMRPDMSNAPSE